MRIIAGTAKGTRLGGPRNQETRPMTARAREAVFSAIGGRLAGARVLDLYSGTGSLGLEALSRGAASVVFVERDRSALDSLDANVQKVGLGGSIRRGDVEGFLSRDDLEYDLAFVDPPYSLSLASVAVVMTRLTPRMTPSGVIVLHRRAGDPVVDPPAGFALASRRRYGDNEIFRYEGELP